MVIVLYNIRSLHNVGSIFRTADAAGISKIYLCGITPAPLDRFGKPRSQLAKVSLGAEKYVPWEKRKSTVGVVRDLKKHGLKILALEQSKHSIPYFKMSSDKNIALILGNEIKGLPFSILRLADKILEIPMHGRKESLNVAVAFGIAVFHLRNMK